jgi:hypothetical protein
MNVRHPILAVLALLLAGAPAVAAAQNDAGSGNDAGNSFATATPITPQGRFTGRLAAGDAHDFYRFGLAEGASVSVLIQTPASATDPVTMLDPNGVPVDVGVKERALGVTHSGALTSEGTVLRLTVHHAVVAGEYRLDLAAEREAPYEYSMCFMNCEQPRTEPIEMIFGGSLKTLDTRVLLVPPSHGDLGDPFGPTVVDYIDATLRGIHRWTAALDEFARDYPAYAYLRDIKVSVEVFDGVKPLDPAGYDVVIGYVAAGPAFRGIASTSVDEQGFLNGQGLRDVLHSSGRTILLSLFGSSPRAGQVAYDFPEVIDLEVVTIHEFGHTFGLGHTTNWDPTLGSDLMNSPATFIYGNGWAAGDGGERTSMKCLSSLDLYGMAVLYRWIPNGAWLPTGGMRLLPNGMPYKWYC